MTTVLVSLIFAWILYRQDKRNQERVLARDIAFDRLASMVFSEGGFDGRTSEELLEQWRRFHKMREEYARLP